jgi:hypothetical protein
MLRYISISFPSSSSIGSFVYLHAPSEKSKTLNHLPSTHCDLQSLMSPKIKNKKTVETPKVVFFAEKLFLVEMKRDLREEKC